MRSKESPRKVKRPTIQENESRIILSRLFGDNYAKHPTKKCVYLGYIDGAIVEVCFCSFICSVIQVRGNFGAVKFGNLVMNKFFDTRGLRCSTMERINFNKNLCAHVMYDNESISFYFWYREQLEEK